jgi:hypothetical protein
LHSKNALKKYGIEHQLELTRRFRTTAQTRAHGARAQLRPRGYLLMAGIARTGMRLQLADAKGVPVAQKQYRSITLNSQRLDHSLSRGKSAPTLRSGHRRQLHRFGAISPRLGPGFRDLYVEAISGISSGRCTRRAFRERKRLSASPLLGGQARQRGLIRALPVRTGPRTLQSSLGAASHARTTSPKFVLSSSPKFPRLTRNAKLSPRIILTYS